MSKDLSVNILPQAEDNNQTLQAALEYLRRGWSVIPIHSIQSGRCTCGKLDCDSQGKHPRIQDWTNQATTDETTVRHWWQRWPKANIGILTGEKSGLLVLDVDGPEGADALAELEATYGPLPETIEAITGSGGRHVLFNFPVGRSIPNKARFHPGLDTRSNGGQFVAAPSLHISGRRYAWDSEHHPDDITLADAPEWLLRLMEKKPERLAAKKVADHIPMGERNATLTSLAGTMRRRDMSQEAIEAALWAENQARCVPPLSRAEVGKIAGSVCQYAPAAEMQRGFNLKDKQEPPWPDPEPIQNTLRPVETLPPAIIPEPLRPWMADISHRMQCPIDFLAIAAIVEAGAIVGAGCGIRPKQHDDWLIIPNLWGGVVARPSMLKTPALSEVLKPLVRLEAEAREVYEEELSYHEAENEAHKATKEALKTEMLAAAKGRAKKGEPVPDMADVKSRFAALEEPEAPVRRRYKTNDSTVEKVGELLNQNPRGILIFRDELVGLLLGWDREDRQTDRAFYLEAWNGFGSFTTDRIGRGTIDVQNMCVSVLGGIQPAKLSGYLYQASSDLQNDGLIQRMQLLVYPDEPANWELIDEYPNTEAKNRAYAILKKISEMKFTDYGADLPEGEGIPFFHFSNEAQILFNEWLTELQARLQAEEIPLMVEHLSKYRSLMPSLALIFHLINVIDGQPGGPVSSLAAEQAAAWCDYLESHARRIYGLVADVSIRAAGELAGKIQKGTLQDGFTVRDVYRNEWHLLDKKELAEAACSELVEAGWLRQCIAEEGKTRLIYSINPKILPENA